MPLPKARMARHPCQQRARRLGRDIDHVTDAGIGAQARPEPSKIRGDAFRVMTPV